MRIRGHRGFGALVLLIVVLLGATVLQSLVARGQNYQITGLVRVCAQASFVPTATVTLTDVNGINAPRTVTTDLGGVYRFDQPPTASYSVAANRSGYFNSAASNPVRFDGSQTVNIDVCMYAHGTPPKVLTVTVQGSGGAPVAGATVAAYSPSNPTGRIQPVTTGTTDSVGAINLSLWPAVFSVRASATGLQTVESSVDVSAVSSTTINLVAAVELYGHVKDVDSGNFLSTGVTAWLYNPSAANTSAFRLIPATVKDSLFEFEDVRVPAGTYTIVVDAKGHLALTATIVLSGTPTEYNVDLRTAPAERFETTVLYGAQDWNNLTIWRNISLNADGTLTGLAPLNLRDLRLQIDATLGNGDGILQSGEVTAFKNWIAAKGPAYVTTEGFLTTNGKAYANSTTPYSSTVVGLETPGGQVWINATAKYSLKPTPPPYIAYGAKNYFVNVTMVPDVNITTYQNFTYTIAFPRQYELTSSTTVPPGAPVTTRNFTRVTVDPRETGGLPQIRMTISQSLNGTARAKVAAPIGKFHAVNATFANYQAFVANNTTITYSAEDSTDPNGHIPDANFTWKFTALPADTRYGIRPEYKYKQNGTFVVNLTVRESGGNTTYRNITIFVDDRLPVANLRTNRTGTGIANGVTLRVNEGTLVRFDGGLSTDLAYPGKPGVILDSGYSWDFDGDRIADATGRIANYSFPKPGQFRLNLTVTDSVGWKSTNATMTAIVNDTKAPVPSWEILDPSRDWSVISSPIERRTIAINASKTTDNHDKLAALNFTWTIPGPFIGEPGTNHTKYGVNVSFAWAEWNTSYKVLLSVRDTGFPGPPHKANTGNLTRDVTVQIDTAIHADLRFEPNTLKVIPADPEEGADVTVTVNYTNKQSRATASNVTAELIVISGGQPTLLPISALHWFDRNGDSKDANRTILSGETVKLVFTTRISGQGNKTLQVNVYDSSEPTTWRNDNRPSAPVNVRQPGWQPYAIAGAVIGVIALFVGGMYARRKIKAGEWRPIRGRRKERVEGEEKKPRKEIKEEKKRL